MISWVVRLFFIVSSRWPLEQINRVALQCRPMEFMSLRKQSSIVFKFWDMRLKIDFNSYYSTSARYKHLPILDCQIYIQTEMYYPEPIQTVIDLNTSLKIFSIFSTISVGLLRTLSALSDHFVNNNVMRIILKSSLMLSKRLEFIAQGV